MNSREKFLNCIKFQSSVFPLYEFGFWVGTAKRWYQEGLERTRGIPDTLADGDTLLGCVDGWEEYPRFEDLDQAIEFDRPLLKLPYNYWIFPEFEYSILQEGKDELVVIDKMGIKKRIKKDNASIPEYLEWPVRNKDNWEKFKGERLNPDSEGRFPPDFDSIVSRLGNRDFPLLLSMGYVGFFGSLRYLLGEVNLMLGYYDFPDLLTEIIDYLADFWIALWDKVLSRITPDCVSLWEDMAYKTGSLISPRLFRQFMLPAYKKLTSFLKENDIEVVLLDTDGNCFELIPLFLEAGITGLFPMEVAAGMDVREVRRNFPNLQIMGGVDKRALATGKEAIDLEIKRVSPVVRSGGYIPFVDHFVPPDVSFSNYRYFRQRLVELAGRA